jgi:hypothetical protein
VKRRLTGMCAAIVMIGCAGAADGDASGTRLAEICQSTTNMSAAVCDCVGKRANDELSPNARAFLVASMDKKEEEAASLRAKLPLEEMTKAGMFFVTAPAACAREGVSK